MKITTKKISELKPADYNPRKSTKAQEANLKASLSKFGLVEPIVYNKRTNQIVGGHFRVRELKKLGIKEVDCVTVDLSPEDEKELNIRLNANTGQWDWDRLANEWDTEILNNWGIDIVLFDTEKDSKEVEINKYNKVHILLSFHPDKFNDVQKYLAEIKKDSEIEYEQSAN